MTYNGTRHNLGGRLIQFICSKKKLRFKPGKGHYYYSINENLILAYSTTFMNNSGIAVLELYENFSLSLENILVILDDINLPFGKLRLRSKGSDGGHKGLHSIIYQLDSENIPRLRIGIGNPENDETSNWVLSKFSEEEEKTIPEILERAKEAVFIWKNQNIDVAMSKINGNQKEVK
jgi:PTH1 family peptidyl-tRNA hydrolase